MAEPFAHLTDGLYGTHTVVQGGQTWQHHRGASAAVGGGRSERAIRAFRHDPVGRCGSRPYAYPAAAVRSWSEADLIRVQAAAFGNHVKAVRLLIAAGAPVDAGGGTPPLLNVLHWSGRSREQQEKLRRLLRDAGGRELPGWYLRWRWQLRYGGHWRLRRWLSSRNQR
jgi:hypothetical protein